MQKHSYQVVIILKMLSNLYYFSLSMLFIENLTLTRSFFPLSNGILHVIPELFDPNINKNPTWAVLHKFAESYNRIPTSIL